MTSTEINQTEYQQIKRIVAEYLQLSAYVQPTYLSQIAAEYPRLIDTIRSMVAYEDQSSNFILDTLPISLNRSAEIDGALFSKDDQAKFTLQSKLSYGGYSQVYQAVQRSPVKRDVAIKFLNRLPKQSLLLAEAEFLASLNHPNIAVLYEFGETTDGRLFMVMELVSGTDLISYAEQQQLNIKGKIALFKQLCLGIAHAHEKGIIHCDIKPNNVLVKEVNGEPTVKIIDFGVSKYQRLNEEETAITGTPAYMAPESLVRKELLIDTRNDVYSMGVLLHRLLTGFMPDFDAPTHPPLNADLQAIINRAMHQDRNQRYSNSLALSDDLNRHLNHEVVKARKPSFLYGFSRFLLKYKIPVIILLAFLLAVGGGYYAQSVQATAAKNAQTEAEQVTSFVIDLLSTVDPEGVGDKQSAVDLVLSAKQQLLALAEPTETDARFMYTVGEMLYRLDRQTDALEMAKKSLQLRKQFTSSKDFALLQHLTQLAKVHRKLREYEQAKNVLLTALDIQKTHDSDPRQLSFIYNQLGNLYFDLKDNDQSIVHHQQALKYRTEINDKKLIADSLNNIGAQYYDKKQWRESGEYFHRSLNLIRQEYGPDHAYTYYVINNLATIEEKQFNWQAAEQMFIEAAKGLSRIYGANHFNTLTSQTNAGLYYVRMERFDDATDMFTQVLQQYTQNQDDYNRIRLLAYLGHAEDKHGQFETSLAYYEQALSLARNTQPTNHFALAMAYFYYGRSLRQNGETDQAESLLKLVMTHDVKHNRQQYHFLLRAQNELAHMHRDASDWQLANELYQEVLQATGVDNSIKKKAIIQSHIGLGKLHQLKGELQKASHHLQSALDLNEALNGRLDQVSGEVEGLLGDLFMTFNQTEQAMVHYKQALEILQQALPAHHSAISRAQEKLNKF